MLLLLLQIFVMGFLFLCCCGYCCYRDCSCRFCYCGCSCCCCRCRCYLLFVICCAAAPLPAFHRTASANTQKGPFPRLLGAYVPTVLLHHIQSYRFVYGFKRRRPLLLHTRASRIVRWVNSFTLFFSNSSRLFIHFK